MDIDEIEKLVDLVAKSGVSQVSIRSEGRRVSVRKGRAVRPAVARPASALVPVPTEEPLAAATNGTAQKEAKRWITAPMVGIFYHAEPPVAPGTQIERGAVVGVIESMKLMNDVRAEHGGTVSEMSVEAGMAVEYGQPLFAVVPPSEEASHE
jgi:acetyl-CoA carboxylase biotin carboxyl carrier protein